jgi:uncharacterized membrane protein YhaH (DUF805 family)
MNLIDLYCSFDGRIGRKTYWIATAAIAAVGSVVVAVMGAVSFMAGVVNGLWVLDIVVLIFLYPQFVVAAKRGHDRNISIWIVGIVFVVTLIPNALNTLFGWAGLNPYDDLFAWEFPNPYHEPLTFVAKIAYLVLDIAMLIELGFRRGTAGPNRYGPDPFAPPDGG